MIDQPVPCDDVWAWDRARSRSTSAQFGSLFIANGIREYCTQCGEMIFADAMGCKLNLRVGQKWLELSFHYPCYVEWERQDPPQRTGGTY